jgi:hypothetical protein
MIKNYHYYEVSNLTRNIRLTSFELFVSRQNEDVSEEGQRIQKEINCRGCVLDCADPLEANNQFEITTFCL